MSRFPVPIVVVSKCLGFATCRYDGTIVADCEIVEGLFLERLQNRARFVAVCPEVEIGLGVPREKIRLVGAEPDQRLVQPATGRDLTEAMREFAAKSLSVLGSDGVDGFVLKSRSPSCGIRDTKFFTDWDSEDVVAYGSGLFARAVIDAYPGAPVEDENRLVDRAIRREFLMRLFDRARRREGRTSSADPTPYPSELL